MVATWLFIFQQWNGQQFVNAYGPTFYVQMGLGSMAFIYTIINGVVGQVMGIGFSFVLDKIGRRRQLMGGVAVSTIFMLLVAILGSRPSPTKAQINMVVASIILFRGFSGISLNACSCESCKLALFESRQLTDNASQLLRWLSISDLIHIVIIGAEIGSIRLRKKSERQTIRKHYDRRHTQTSHCFPQRLRLPPLSTCWPHLVPPILAHTCCPSLESISVPKLATFSAGSPLRLCSSSYFSSPSWPNDHSRRSTSCLSGDYGESIA